MPLTQVRFPGAARDFLPIVNFQRRRRLSFGVRKPPYAIACINICAHDRGPVVHVRVRWIMATPTYQARTIDQKKKKNQLDECGRSTEKRRRVMAFPTVQKHLHGKIFVE